MKKIDLGQTIAILANLGVIGGLIFVGLQLEQEAAVAQADRMLSLVEGRRQWAELVSMNSEMSNAELWAKGRDGEPLPAEEAIVFDALVIAWEADLWVKWFLAESAPNAVDPSPGSRWVNEIALELKQYPGLAAFWERHKQHLMETVGYFDDDWENLVDAELSR